KFHHIYKILQISQIWQSFTTCLKKAKLEGVIADWSSKSPAVSKPCDFVALIQICRRNAVRAGVGTMQANLMTMRAMPVTLVGGVRSSSTKIATAGVGCGGSVANQDSTVGTLSPAISIAVRAAAVKRTHLQMGSRWAWAGIGLNVKFVDADAALPASSTEKIFAPTATFSSTIFPTSIYIPSAFSATFF
uniref:Uncharacterized protein n=1 Tax=Romanomermis culicivorax TaxID=13658 RepID=A0A915HU25_ROMCU